MSNPSTSVRETALPGIPLFLRGKVREMYEVGPDQLLMVASDRISAFDVVMNELVPGKGDVLNGISNFWFKRTGHIVPNHMISVDVKEYPAELHPFEEQLTGRSMLVKRTERLDVECVVRGYLAGSGWAEYRQKGTLADEPLPPGLLESAKLPEPRFTPAIKAETGHDENISRAQLRDILGADLADRLEKTSIALYEFAEQHARKQGVILADTKFEFGLLDGELVLIDEILTPDSSRYWPLDQYQPGEPQPSFDKQYLRDYLEEIGWGKSPPPPTLPEDVIRVTSEKYREAMKRITGGQTMTFQAEVHVTLKPSVNDPEGQSIRGGLRSLGFADVDSVRSGKYIQVKLEAADKAAAEAAVDQMCAKLLANPVIEQYSFSVTEA